MNPRLGRPASSSGSLSISPGPTVKADMVRAARALGMSVTGYVVALHLAASAAAADLEGALSKAPTLARELTLARRRPIATEDDRSGRARQ